MRIGYIRVSTVDQNSARQLDGISIDKTFEDHCSGSTTNRPGLDQLMDFCREGDRVIVHDISRLARNIEDLLKVIRLFHAKNVEVEFMKENLVFCNDKESPINRLLLALLGAVYEFERSILLERQREGIIKAKAKGHYRGKPKTIDRNEVWQKLDDGFSIRKTASLLNISPTSVAKIKMERVN
ncbi:recombinase family protein [Corallincola platygyrae]|uniref:Recombinase family protein n=1 Tax=Corallincola platygyrae TaxID=1193278 RepID=A0ABW4XIR4_9GAMM